MAWVLDTCVLIDVLENDPEFGPLSAVAIDGLAPAGLEISPVTYAELAPAFDGDRALQDEFLLGVGVALPAEWSWADTMAAHAAWARWIRLKREGTLRRRPIADVLIGAHAAGRDGLVTRNPQDFTPIFPDLPLAVPA